MFDVVGVGALNVDYIVAREQVRTRPDIAAEITDKFDPNRERLVCPDKIAAAKNHIGANAFTKCLGGSAFNVLNALYRAAGDQVRLGFVGSSGYDPDNTKAFPFRDWFADGRRGVDCQFVSHTEQAPCGMCLSYVDAGERSLLTTPGANDLAARLLAEHKTEIIEYLAKAKIVHVTSFLDDKTPKALSAVLEAVKRRSPSTLISFDPGYEWCAKEGNGDESIRSILKLSDIVFVNADEFRLLGAPIVGVGDEVSGAKRILNQCSGNAALVFQKNYARIRLFHRILGSDVISRSFWSEAIPGKDIKDATGAGDVFAAGVLLGRLIPGMQLSESIALGQKMVRIKLTTGKYMGFQDALDSTTKDISSRSDVDTIFIGHGGDGIWMTIRDHLVQHHALQIRCWETDAEKHVGKPVIKVIESELDKSSFGIFVLTAEDPTADKAIRARQNVIHEMGLFQGRYGFDNAILVVEKGVQRPSNLDGVVTVELDRDNLADTFQNIDNQLRRRGRI